MKANLVAKTTNADAEIWDIVDSSEKDMDVQGASDLPPWPPACRIRGSERLMVVGYTRARASQRISATLRRACPRWPRVVATREHVEAHPSISLLPITRIDARGFPSKVRPRALGW